MSRTNFCMHEDLLKKRFVCNENLLTANSGKRSQGASPLHLDDMDGQDDLFAKSPSLPLVGFRKWPGHRTYLSYSFPLSRSRPDISWRLCCRWLPCGCQSRYAQDFPSAENSAQGNHRNFQVFNRLLYVIVFAQFSNYNMFRKPKIGLTEIF